MITSEIYSIYIVGMCSLVYNVVWYLPMILNKFKREKHASFAYEFSTLVITNIMLCGKNKRWGQKSKHQYTTFKGQRIPCRPRPPSKHVLILGVKNFCFICLLTDQLYMSKLLNLQINTIVVRRYMQCILTLVVYAYDPHAPKETIRQPKKYAWFQELAS